MKSQYPIILLYFFGSILLLFPIFSDWRFNLIGILSTDNLDTLGLQYSFSNPKSRFFPIGFNSNTLTPNFLDHLLFWCFQWLPFPFSHSLTVVCILTLNGIAGHFLGEALAYKDQSPQQSQLKGYWIGWNVLAMEALWREMNIGHMPQILLFAPIFSLAFTLRWQYDHQPKNLYLAAFFYALAGMSYWFWLPMLSPIICVILFKKWAALFRLHMMGLLLLLPNLYWLFFKSSGMVPNPIEKNSSNHLELFQAHSNDWMWWWSNAPMDVSNRISLLLLGMVIWQLLQKKQKPFWAFSMVLLGMVMLLGNHSILYFLYDIPPLSRLMWPERWGWLVGLGLCILAMPRQITHGHLIWLPLIFLELSIQSHNFPVQSTSLRPLQCYEQLQSAKGAILELPLEKSDPLYNRMNVTQQLHQQNLVNPIILPPNHFPLLEWEEYKDQAWLQHFDGKGILQPEDIQQARNEGVSLILIDSSNLSAPHQSSPIIQHIIPLLGPPINLGCALIWPLIPSEQHYQQYPQLTFPKIQRPIHQEPIHVW